MFWEDWVWYGFIALFAAFVLLFIGVVVRRELSPKLELVRNEWVCTRHVDKPVQTFVMAGKVMVPMLIHETVCAQWTSKSDQ